MKFFIYLSPAIFLLLLAVRVIERNNNFFTSIIILIMKGTKVQTLGERAVAGAWLVAWAIMAMGAIISTHAHC